MVAVGFNPTVGVSKENQRRVAKHETADSQMVLTRSGRQSATPNSMIPNPWVKTTATFNSRSATAKMLGIPWNHTNHQFKLTLMGQSPWIALIRASNLSGMIGTAARDLLAGESGCLI
jgi:hypothetical protein